MKASHLRPVRHTALLLMLLQLFLVSCGGSGASRAAHPVDIDLTNVSANIVYSSIYNMKQTPGENEGKTMAMSGQFTSYEAPSAVTGQTERFYSLLIEDATKCCNQSVEFIWEGEHRFPEDYPASGTEVTVTGTCAVSAEHGYETFLLKADAVSFQ